MEILMKAHKEEKSPYKVVNEYISIVEKYCKETTKLLISSVCSAVNVDKKLQKAESDPLVFKGQIQYSPRTGKAITQGEWKKLEDAIVKYLGIEKSSIQTKISKDSYWLGNLLNRMEADARKKVSFKSISVEEEKDFAKAGFNSYDKIRMELSNQFAGVYIQNVNDRTRSKIQQILLDGARQHKTSRKVFDDLWDLEEDVNRDWERVVRTEIPANINNGYMTSLLRSSNEEHIFVKGLSAPGACKYCERMINNQIAVLVERPVSNGFVKVNGTTYPAIWPGKSNFGRKAANYWVATIMHPHCRCTFQEWFIELEGLV